jgi:hypothetical protein
MIKQKTTTINGEEFLLSTIPATKGIKLLKQLTKLIGPSFTELLKGGEDGGEGANPMGVAMEKLFDNLDTVDVESLIKELVASSATKGSMAINFDMEFSGEYGKLFTLVKEIVEFNYGSVFTMFGSEESL